MPIPPPWRWTSWISSLPSPGAIKWQPCDFSYSLDTRISEMVAGVTCCSNGQNGSMFLSRIFHHEVIAESCSQLFSPQSSLGYFNSFPSSIPLPPVVSPFFSSPCIMSINSLLLQAALSCNQEPYWYRMSGWHSLLYLYHDIILVYFFGNYALWFHCWNRANNKNNNLLNYTYSAGNRQIRVVARFFGGYNNDL